jgi:hypothetical protein
LENKKLDTSCTGCEFLKLIYELDDRQYSFGCDSNLTCDKIKQKEDENNDRSTSR